MLKVEKGGVGDRSLRFTAAGLGLMVAGAETFFAFSESLGVVRWVFALVVFAGILAVGLGVPLERAGHAGWWARLGVVFLFSSYLTVSAFFRYPGLAKDIDPTSHNIMSYFGRVVLTIAVAVSVASIPRILSARQPDSHSH